MMSTREMDELQRFPSLPRWRSRSFRVLLTLGAIALYALAFEPLNGVVAREAVAFAILPVIIAGTLVGRSGGLIAGAASIPLNVLLFSQVTAEDPIAVLNNPAQMVQVLLIGLLMGLLGEWFGWLREQREELRQAHESLQALVQSSPEAIIALDTAGNVTQWNAAAEQMFGWTEAEVLRSPLPFIPEEKQTEHRELRERVLRGEGFTDVEVVRFRRDGTPMRISVSTAPLQDKGGRVRGIISINQDITERKRAEEALQARVRQQAAVAWLGQLALGGLDLPELMGEATHLLADTLEVELTEVTELLPGGRELVLRAGSGWSPGVVGNTVIDAVDTQAGYTLQIAEPVVVEDLRTDLRFSGSPLLHQHGVISGMSVLILARGRPFGVLGAHSVVPRSFSEDDVNFLHAVANVLAQAIDRTRANEALRESEERFRQLVESADDIIYRADANGFFTYANPVAVRSMGYTEDQLLGMHFLDLIRPDFHEPTTEFYAKQFREKIPNTYWEFPAITRDGRELWLGQNVQLVREEGMLGVQAVARDITAKREIERIKDEFVSVVSHELRTPLTSIRGSLGLLASGRMGELSPQGERLLTIAVQNTDRLVRLINDILDLERMQSGRATLEKRVCSAAELMAQAMNTVASAAEAAGVRLRVEPSSEFISADPDRIVQVLVNLLGNAIKFSPPDTEIRLDVERRGEKFWIRVRDQGRGIPPDKIDSIFGRFQQVDSSDSREKGGTGLGLAICRSIVEQHGGQIWAHSVPAEGSTFIFTLPTDGTERLGGEQQGGIRRVLVAEDDVDLARVLTEMLERHGLAVQVAHTGRDTVRLAEHLLPDLLLLDVLLPDGDGFAVTEQFRAHRILARLPTVVYSAREIEGKERERLRLGPTDFLTKSRIAPELLEERVLHLLHSRNENLQGV